MGLSVNNTDMSSHKVEAEIAKLMAETMKINAEACWYPWVVASTLVGSVAAITAIIIKLF